MPLPYMQRDLGGGYDRTLTIMEYYNYSGPQVAVILLIFGACTFFAGYMWGRLIGGSPKDDID